MQDISERKTARMRRPPTALRKLVPVFVVVAVAMLAGLTLLLPPRSGEAPPTEAPPVNVEVQVVRTEPEVIDTLDLPAVVEANQVVRVAAEVPGRLERIALEEGAACKVGAPIIYLNTDLLRAEFARAQAQADYDARQFERKSNLYSDGGIAPQELDEAAAKMAVSQAAMQAAKANLDRATIVAPISGTLNDLPVEKGEYVQPGTTVAEIVDVETVKVVVYVPERDVQYLKTGSEVRVFADSKGQSNNLTGLITYIDELADERTRSTRVEVTVDNRDRLLRSGQIARVRLTRRVLEDVIMIPLLAVVPLEEGRVVYVVEEGTAQRREVELGLIRGRSIQVRSGLEVGDRLIVSGHRFVGPGQEVLVLDER